MKKIIPIIMLLIGCFFISGCDSLISGNESSNRNLGPADLSIAAASSLKEAMDELTYIFEDENPEINLEFYYASSGDLQNQIESGKTTDLFISGAQKQMILLEQDGYINSDTKQILAQNSIVLIAPEDSELTSVDELTDSDIYYITIGEPSTVPSGQYATQALQTLGLYDAIEDKLEFAKSTAEIIEDVEKDNTYAAFVYKTDAVGNNDIRIVEEIPITDYSSIVYPMAATSNTAYLKQVEALENFLLSDQAQSILESYGFTPTQTNTEEETVNP